MKLLILVLLITIITLTRSAPIDDSNVAQILRYESDNIGVDGYKFAFETSDGIARQEEAIIKNPGTDDETLSIRGTISWIAPDGETYTINFIADENGFQPEGNHIPRT